MGFRAAVSWKVGDDRDQAIVRTGGVLQPGPRWGARRAGLRQVTRLGVIELVEAADLARNEAHASQADRRRVPTPYPCHSPMALTTPSRVMAMVKRYPGETCSLV